MKLYLKFNDIFFKFDGEVFHSLNGQIYTAKCDNVNKIIIHEEVESCTKDLPVSFLHKFENKFGYLTYDGIIRERNDIVPCDSIKKYLTFSSNQLIKYRNKIELQPNKLTVNIYENANKTIAEYYDDVFGPNTWFRMIQDLCVSVFIMIAFIYAFIKSKILSMVYSLAKLMKRYYFQNN
jgi:hypothetical protein